MGLTFGIVLVFFAGLMAVLYFGYQQVEKDRAEKAAAEGSGPRAAEPPHGRTADEVVFDLEHRIESDRQEVAELLGRSAPGAAHRLYRG
jgi:hypothetical protein